MKKEPMFEKIVEASRKMLDGYCDLWKTDKIPFNDILAEYTQTGGIMFTLFYNPELDGNGQPKQKGLVDKSSGKPETEYSNTKKRQEIEDEEIEETEEEFEEPEEEQVRPKPKPILQPGKKIVKKPLPAAKAEEDDYEE